MNLDKVLNILVNSRITNISHVDEKTTYKVTFVMNENEQPEDVNTEPYIYQKSGTSIVLSDLKLLISDNGGSVLHTYKDNSNVTFYTNQPNKNLAVRAVMQLLKHKYTQLKQASADARLINCTASMFNKVRTLVC